MDSLQLAPAEPTAPAPPATDQPPRPPMATVAIAVEQDDGTMITVMWDLPAAAGEQEIALMRDRRGPSTGSAIFSAGEAADAADYIYDRGLRVDL